MKLNRSLKFKALFFFQLSLFLKVGVKCSFSQLFPCRTPFIRFILSLLATVCMLKMEFAMIRFYLLCSLPKVNTWTTDLNNWSLGNVNFKKVINYQRNYNCILTFFLKYEVSWTTLNIPSCLLCQNDITILNDTVLDGFYSGFPCEVVNSFKIKCLLSLAC